MIDYADWRAWLPAIIVTAALIAIIVTVMFLARKVRDRLIDTDQKYLKAVQRRGPREGAGAEREERLQSISDYQGAVDYLLLTAGGLLALETCAVIGLFFGPGWLIIAVATCTMLTGAATYALRHRPDYRERASSATQDDGAAVNPAPTLATK